MYTKPCVAGLTLFPRFNSSKIDAKSDVCSVHVAGVFQRIFSSALRKQPCQRSQNLQRVYEVTDPHRRAHKTLRMRKSIEKPQRTSPERRTGETADATGAAHSLARAFRRTLVRVRASGARTGCAPAGETHRHRPRAPGTNTRQYTYAAQEHGASRPHMPRWGSTTQTHPPRSALRAADRRRVHIRGHLPP